ncbi:MAG: helix-turn-helix domain-containing protein [Propionibacteriaceae bacterium]
MIAQKITRPSITQLVTTLSYAGVRLVTKNETSTPVSHTHIWEPSRAIPELTGGILLTPGAIQLPSQVIRDTAAKGFSAIMIKPLPNSLDEAIPTAESCDIALFTIDDELEWLHLDKLITQAIQAVQGTDSGLGSLAVGDLFSLADAIAAATGGATAIEDPEQRILAYSTLPDQPIDNDRQLGILGRQVPDMPENEIQYRQVFRAESVIRLPALPGGGYDRLAVPVRAGKQLLGSIWVIDSGTLADTATEYLSDIAALATLHLLRARSAEDLSRQIRSDVVEQIFDATLPAKDGVRRLGMSDNGPFYVIALEPADPDVTAGPALQQAADLATLVLESRFETAAVSLRGVQIRALLAGIGEDEHHLLASALTHISDQSAASFGLTLNAAISESITSAPQIKGARRSTDRVLRLLRRQPWRGNLASSLDLATELSLEDLERFLRQRPELLSTAARDITSYDKTHRTSYAELLLTWLGTGHDTALTASRLALHPNTVRYRLGRVSSLFGLDIHDADALLLTWLSLRSLA